MDFKKEVIDLSFEMPVVVDFWAPWCGPCQHLGPVLEELAGEAHGKWTLVKVNVDDNQEVSNRFGIRGIPDVRMFYKGNAVAKFTGALPRYQIQSWLQEHLPDERIDELEKITADIRANNSNLEELELFVNKNPDVAEASLTLAEHLVFRDHSRALELIQPFTGQAKYLDRVENVKALARLMDCNGEGKTAERLEVVKKAIQKTDFDAALNTLIETVMIDKNYCDELPRQATIAMFHYLGESHELTRKYRRRFDMALY